MPGLYLAGDADGDVQFAVVAAAEGAVAINRELTMKIGFRPIDATRTVDDPLGSILR